MDPTRSARRSRWAALGAALLLPASRSPALLVKIG
jgi:hypothetical protein